MVSIVVLIAKTRSQNLKSAIKYADKDRKAEGDFTLCRGVNCSDFATIAFEQMKETKCIYGKEGGRECKHYVLSFAPGEIGKESAIEYAEKLTERCFGDHFQAFVGLHTRSESGVLHAHIIVNSDVFNHIYILAVIFTFFYGVFYRKTVSVTVLSSSVITSFIFFTVFVIHINI